ncbi:MAG: hypothetical protein N0E48_26695 [Candidatus Thiodiazotropha endolucinida]|nr:hypothetical protein [Candidatus Thiodiazotropha taylori]MCW4346917.1 hypothetical protein [Candidatus Thiodiazotropha endolucinida]
MGDQTQNMDLGVDEDQSCELDIDNLNANECTTKRKGSPLSSTDVKKQVSIKEGLRRRNSFPDITKISKSKSKSSSKSSVMPMAFSDMMRVTFDDQSFKDSITPVLYDMVCPLIQETIQTTVTTAVTKAIESIRTNVLDEMIKSNKSLQDSVNKQNAIIKEQKSVIEEQRTIIDTNNDMVEDLQNQVYFLTAEIDELRCSVNDLEQYGRRNSLRINNLDLSGPSGPPANEEALTSAVVYFVNTAVLKGSGKLSNSDIERCHYIGKRKSTGPQQILVKFARYHDKRRVFLSKKNLKNNPNKIFMTEDLTAVNHSLVKSLLPLKKNGTIDSFWTRDGRVLVKKDRNGDPVRLSPNDSIGFKLGLVNVEEHRDNTST